MRQRHQSPLAAEKLRASSRKGRLMVNFNAWILAFVASVLIENSSIRANDPISSDLSDLHPKMFAMVLCQLSDTEQPVVTEFNLDAIRKNRNQFDFDEIKSRQGWKETTGSDGQGFHRFRVLQSAGTAHRIEYQANSGGTLTSTAVIEFSVESRTIKIDDNPVSTRVLKITSVSK